MQAHIQLLRELRELLAKRHARGDRRITAVDLENDVFVFTYDNGRGVFQVRVDIEDAKALTTALEGRSTSGTDPEPGDPQR